MRALGLVMAGFLIGAAAIAATDGRAAPQPDPLAKVEAGGWRLHEIGSSAAPRSVCVSDPHLLTQVEHGSRQCERYVLDAAGNKTVVRYACTGAGHGRTTVTVESAKLLRIQTQGVVNGAPFEYDYEARRVGSCT